MRTGLNIEDLAKKIQLHKTQKVDYIVPAGKTSMIVDGGRVQLAFREKEEIFLPLMPVAHDQVGGFCGVPGRYYDKMLAEAPSLLCNNVNHWMSQSPKRRMVRSLAGEGRAYLSDRYNRIENDEIAEIALPVLVKIPDVKFVSTEVTTKRMYIQAVSPRLEGEVKKGDVVQAGVCIANSEVGCGSVSVTGMLWRLVCLNGMVVGTPFRAYHVGRQVEDTEALWRDDTRAADDRVVLLKVRDMIEACLDPIVFGERLDRARELVGMEVHKKAKVEEVVEVLAQKVSASETEQDGILQALIRGGDLSAWGLANAVTAQAHEASSYDRAVEIEQAGGALLEMPRAEWKRILQPA